MASEGFDRGAVAVVGAATYGLGVTPGYTSMELAAVAAKQALNSAYIPLGEVDGLFICLPDDFFSGLSAAEYLGIQPRVTDNNRTGGSAFMTHMVHAAMALQSGMIDTALIMYGSNQHSASGKIVTPRQNSPYEAPYRPVVAASHYALAASRHMYEYGTKREDLAAVALAARKWAHLNPEAFERGDLTLEDCLSARMVSDPLTVRDCCLVTDGAAAIVMVRSDRARDYNGAAAYLLGGAAATWHNSIAQLSDLTVTAAVESGARAFLQAKLDPKDVSCVQLYDAFTINTILFLEDLGFCQKGEGGDLVSSGAIAPGGVLPVNTNGGGLSCCHPGMYGLMTVVEAYRQLVGQCGDRQLKNMNVALAHGNGGTLSSQATVILGREAVL
jgi:acetyl-CoA acetyltransferase